MTSTHPIFFESEQARLRKKHPPFFGLRADDQTMRLPTTDIEHMIRLRLAGASWPKVGKALGIHHQTAFKIVIRHLEDRDVTTLALVKKRCNAKDDNKPKPPRPRKRKTDRRWGVYKAKASQPASPPS
jgi:hypothetical protein